MGMMQCRRAATQANISVGPKNGIFMFLLYKIIYIYVVFKIMQYMYKAFLKEHWWAHVLSWSDKLETVGWPKVSFF